MSIIIQISGTKKKFDTPIDAIAYLSTLDYQGFTKEEYDKLVKTVNSDKKKWTKMTLQQFKKYLKA